MPRRGPPPSDGGPLGRAASSADLVEQELRGHGRAVGADRVGRSGRPGSGLGREGDTESGRQGLEGRVRAVVCRAMPRSATRPAQHGWSAIWVRRPGAHRRGRRRSWCPRHRGGRRRQRHMGTGRGGWPRRRLSRRPGRRPRPDRPSRGTGAHGGPAPGPPRRPPAPATDSGAGRRPARAGIPYVFVADFPAYLPSPHHPPFEQPGRPFPPGVTDNRTLWDLDVEGVRPPSRRRPRPGADRSPGLRRIPRPP
ncbi:hypothetical protein BN159_0513 [Streptomyces davaonensis JCM 4913]|uniref:Uncharacterized protein n=1 Tax=Streptomyces davaonensis (strain DSM 101723 / JCM 4913 / KCC S-0913 / 768) TaxID=1214101 RepID=K4QVE2_STRDJ|nr:hypothetical protein BN159_0513 [Streptomyces davaonensis JCM 4913]